MRLIFFAGKGGVGKTSVAAATGIRAAEAGHRTVILSLDAAHSLSDIFDLEKGLLDQNRGRPVKVRDRLWIQELDIQREIEKNWGDIHKYLSLILNTTGLDEILAEELAILPGMEEVSLLLYINRYARENTYDVVLLDCAPTGESLRFISIPTTLEWYIKKIFRMERTIAKYVRPVAKRLYDIPLPSDDYFAAIETLFKRLQGVDAILVDPKVTTVRLVTNPEKIVLKETQRAFMYFCLYRMSIDAVVMNRIIPGAVKDRYFDDWREKQGRYVAQAKEYFSPVPIFPVDLFKSEVVGYDSLRALARELYGDRDPLGRFFKGEPYRFTKENGEYRLAVRLPFLTQKDVELSRVADELIVRIGTLKQHILLPRQVAAADRVTAAIEGRNLLVRFGSENHGQE